MKNRPERICEGIRKISNGILFGISGCFLFILTALSFCFTAYVAYDDTERVSIVTGFPLMPVVLALVLAGGLYGIVKLSDIFAQKGRFREIGLYFFWCILYTVLGGILIAHTDGSLREEPLRVYETARQFAQGDYQALKAGGYIFHKVHQLGMVTYDRLLGLFSTDTKFVFWINLLLINAINYLTYKLSDCWFQSRRVNVLTICISYLFLPQFFFVLFAYGLIPGFFFTLLAVYCMERYFLNGKKYYPVISLVAVSVAAALKSNYLIAGIALALLCLLRFFKQQKKCFLGIAMAAVLLPVFMLKLVPWCYHLETGMPINEGEPMLTYVAMGINPMNEGIGPGWYDGSNYMWYKDAGYDNALTIQKAKECIRNCFMIYQENPVGSIKFFMRKIVSQWCEPMYQSVWSGPLQAMGQKVETGFLQALYGGEGPENAICLWMKGMQILLCISALMFVVQMRKGEFRAEYAYIFFIGGFLFHMFWEAKSQYIYPYVFVLIPACAKALDGFYEKSFGSKC